MVQKRGGVHVRGTHRLENVTSVTRQRYFHAHAEMAKQEKNCAPRSVAAFQKGIRFLSVIHSPKFAKVSW